MVFLTDSGAREFYCKTFFVAAYAGSWGSGLGEWYEMVAFITNVGAAGHGVYSWGSVLVVGACFDEEGVVLS